MATWKTICCALDFSEPSRLALQEAADLARTFDGELTLVHVYEAPAVVTKDMTVPAAHVLEQTIREIERKLDGWREVAARIAGSPVVARVVTGEVAHEVLRFLREGGFDLAVLGTHGRTGLQHLVLGSVAERVVRQAPCPVLIIRPRPDGHGPEAPD